MTQAGEVFTDGVFEGDSSTRGRVVKCKRTLVDYNVEVNEGYLGSCAARFG